MIKKIIIRNFQSHKRTVIGFDSGVNVLYGSSDSGKSAIIRALNWVLFNYPQGDAFRSYWGGETKVTIYLDGHKISRIRGKENAYELDGQKFTAFGNNVPEQIQEVINMDSINLQKQFNTPFLIGESPGQIARILNESVDLSEMAKNVKLTNKLIGKFKQNIESNETVLNEVNSKLEKLEPIFDLSEDLSVVEKKVNLWLSINSGNKKIEGLIVASEKLLEELNQFKNLDKATTLLNLLVKVQDQYKKIDLEVSLISKLVKQYNELKLVAKSHKDINPANDLFSELSTLIETHQFLTQKYDSLDSVLYKFHKRKEELSYLESRIKEVEKSYSELMPDVCPLCGRSDA
jgi:exonuclease SbcC